MKEVLRYFGEANGLEERIKRAKPSLGEFFVLSNCMDNAVYFEDISKEDFYDVCELLEEGLYSVKDISLEQTLVNFLINNGIRIATAESCTGGMVASSIVNVSGASQVFYEGLITYSNLSKENRLGVKKDTIMEFGAVSEETAKEMAYGLLSDNVDVAVSTTGIAGPSGGSEEKPVGLVYIGIAMTDSDTIAIKNIFNGTREQIRKSAKNAALFYTWQQLNKNL